MDSNPPDPTPPPAVALAGFRVRYRSPRFLAKFVTAMLVLHVGVLGTGALLVWDFLDLAKAELAGQSVSQEALDEVMAHSSDFQWMGGAVWILCVVAFSMWTYRVARNVVDTDGSLSFSPGWAVGSYFIPILTLWRPYRALAEVWDASDPDRAAERSRAMSHGLLLAWWFVWILSRIGNDVVDLWREPSTLEGWIAQLHVGLVAIAVDMCATGLALAVVWRLTGRQDLRAASAVPVARVV